MKPFPIVLSSIIVFLSSMVSPSSVEAFEKTVNLTAKDGTLITAYWFDANHSDQNSKTTNTIILFHQAGASAMGEYQSIIPKLTLTGLNVLAVDLRSGGDKFGGTNKTASAFEGKVPYCDALPDMQASVEWVTKMHAKTKVIIWGSSYSAAAVFRIASENPYTINAVMGFSPASGDAMGNCKSEPYLDKVNMPAIAFRPSTEMSYDSVIKQSKVFAAHDIKYIEIPDGVHGSSMLVETRTKKDMSHAWKEVYSFLSPWTK